MVLICIVGLPGTILGGIIRIIIIAARNNRDQQREQKWEKERRDAKNRRELEIADVRNSAEMKAVVDYCTKIGLEKINRIEVHKDRISFFCGTASLGTLRFSDYNISEFPGLEGCTISYDWNESFEVKAREYYSKEARNFSEGLARELNAGYRVTERYKQEGDTYIGNYKGNQYYVHRIKEFFLELSR